MEKMKMDKSGIVFFYRLMLGIVIIILGIALAFPTAEPINESKDNLSCDSPSSDFDQGTCWFLDIVKFMFVGGIIFIGVFILTKLR